MSRRLRRPSPETQEELQPRLWIALIGLALVVVYVVAFVAKNDEEVDLDFIFFTSHVGLIWLLLLGFVLGLVVGVVLSQLYRRRRRHGGR
jgi:uncharacterized integral membrane protein